MADETTILRFPHLLVAKRLLVQSGTIVDGTIIAAPSPTKNASQARDPEMRQTRKGNTWFFGIKLHVGVRRAHLEPEPLIPCLSPVAGSARPSEILRRGIATKRGAQSGIAAGRVES